MVDLCPDDTPELKSWRREVRAFLEEALPQPLDWDYDYDEDPAHWTAGLEFWRKVGQKRWFSLTWPKDLYGQGRSPIEKWILDEEFCEHGAPAYPGIGVSVADAVLRLGTPEQRKRHLKGIAEATILWGEGYTEPGAGSDLASLRTRAVRDGDSWVLDGQKTLGTVAHQCQWMMVLARTDPEAKHAGISCFLVPLDAPGIVMLPLHNIAGGQQNQTFFDNVRVPLDSVVGDVNQAWTQVWFRMGGEKIDRGGPEFSVWDFRLVKMFRKVVRYCQETKRNGVPLSEDPVIRVQLGELITGIEAIKMLAFENYSSFATGERPAFGEVAGHVELAVFKEFWPRLAQICMDIVGPLAQIRGGKWAQINGKLEHFYRASFGNHAGGTSQLKRMVIATRGLGLPR